MGDNGQMYVPKELLPIYRDEIIPLADIITPNQYEIELLTERKIQNENDVWETTKYFHENKNIKIVALSSTDLGETQNQLKAFLSVKNDDNIKYVLNIPKQGDGISFTGTGDLFASLFLAHSSLNSDISKAFEYTTATLQTVIKRTIDALPDDVKLGKRKVTSYERELKLIQSKKDIEEPNVILKAKKI